MSGVTATTAGVSSLPATATIQATLVPPTATFAGQNANEGQRHRTFTNPSGPVPIDQILHAIDGDSDFDGPATSPIPTAATAPLPTTSPACTPCSAALPTPKELYRTTPPWYR